MDWVAIAELATALGTIALAIATGCMSWLSYKSIRQAEEKEKHHSTPIVVFDFNDAEGEEGQGAPGFRMHPDSGTGHQKALLSGILRNISAVAAIDCRLRIVYSGENSRFVNLMTSPFVAESRLVNALIYRKK